MNQRNLSKFTANQIGSILSGRYINHSVGSLFATPLKISGYLLVVIGIVVTVSGGWGILLGLVLLAVGGFFGFTKTGVVVDTRRKAIKQYTQYYGFKRGSFKEYNNYPFVAVIPKKVGNSFRNEKTAYEVNRLSKSQRGKVLLGIFHEEEEANDYARGMATVFSSDLIEYKPRIQ